MRQLLLAALGVSGSLLLDLSALAQLSNTTSTFSGQIAANCAFNGLDAATQMNYEAERNHLFGMDDFTITTNAPLVRLGISSVNTISEPQVQNGTSVVADAGLHHLESGRWVMVANGSKSTGSTRNSYDYSQNTSLRFTSLVYTENQNNQLSNMEPGAYSYSVTISCLL